MTVAARAVSIAVMSIVLAGTAHAEMAAWDGFQAIGVSEPQLATLSFVVQNALEETELVAGVLDDGTIAARCGLNVGCHCAHLRARRVRYGAFGSMGQLGDQWTIEMTLVDAHACSVASTAFLEESIRPDRVATRVAELARQLAVRPEEVASTATGGGTSRPIDATPAIVTTFTRGQLRALDFRSLEDLLPYVPGFDVLQLNYGGIVLDQNLATTLLFLSDGVPLVNGLGSFRILGRDFRSSLSYVDRVEIVRGPGAVLWGQNAFMGVVNLISETPVRREAAVEAGVSVGTLETEEVWVRGEQNRGAYAFAAAVDIGRRVGPATYVEDTPYATVAVPMPLVFGNGGTTRPRADLWLDAHLRLAIERRVELTVQNLTSDVEFEISPRGALLEPGLGGRWSKTHRLYALRGEQPLFTDSGARLALRGTVSRYELYSWERFAIQPRWPAELEQPMGAARDLSTGLTSVQGNDRPRAAHQADLRMVHEIAPSGLDGPRGLRNQLTVGLGALHMRTPASLATLTGIDEEPASHNVSFKAKHFLTLSSFVFDELSPVPWLALNAGARLQLDKPVDADVTPGAPPLDRATWRLTARLQGGAAVRSGRFGAKLVYAEGFRPPDGVQRFSRVGTEGNPALVPEQSREVAALASVEMFDGLTVRVGGNLTRITKLILLDPTAVTDPIFAYKPVNRGEIDVASGYVEMQLTRRHLDVFGNWHVSDLRESDPLGEGIPIARYTAAAAAVWRPLTDLSLFVRGAVASSRRVQLQRADGVSRRDTDWTVRTAVGLTLSDVIDKADLQLRIDNPLLREQELPYQVDGAITTTIELRRATELFAVLRWDR